MAEQIFDTSFLIFHWRNFPRHRVKSEENVRNWARVLIRTAGCDALCTPVLIEMLAGTQNPDDLKLHRAFLGEFRNVDEHNIPPSDWRRAQHYAQRVRVDGSPRNFGDCLIRAIADRLHCSIFSRDRWFREL